MATVGFILIVVVTPREWVSAFAGYAVLLAGALVAARIPARRVATGLAIEVPFVVFALLLPLVGPAPETVLGLSVEGLWAAWNILAKATLGVLAATLLAATTLPVELVAGLQALRLPGPFIAILTFFIRYVDIVADQYRRMRTAQHARGMRPSVSSWPVIASGLGALFVRSYERGERVHLALVSRGYTGRLSVASADGAGPAWVAALLPAGALVVLVLRAAPW